MGLVLEFNEWVNMKEEVSFINEGLMDWIAKGFRKMFGKKHGAKMREMIASDIVDEMINQKTGELEKVVTAKDIQNAKNVDEVFNKLDKAVPEGKYFRQSIKFMRDSVKELADKGIVMDVAKEKMGKEESPQAGDIGKKSVQSLEDRGKQFNEIYGKAKVTVLKNAEADVAEYLKTIDQKKYPWIHTDVNRRLRNAQTVLLLIEYDIKKFRWSIENVADLRSEMVDAWKKTINYSREMKKQLESIKKIEPDDVKKMYKVGQEIDWINNKGNVVKSKITGFDVEGEIGVMMQTMKQGTVFHATYEQFAERMMKPESEKEGAAGTPKEGTEVEGLEAPVK